MNHNYNDDDNDDYDGISSSSIIAVMEVIEDMMDIEVVEVVVAGAVEVYVDIDAEDEEGIWQLTLMRPLESDSSWIGDCGREMITSCLALYS